MDRCLWTTVVFVFVLICLMDWKIGRKHEGGVVGCARISAADRGHEVFMHDQHLQ